jgi:transcriptional regulator with XRE-family HTH domain
LQEYAVYEKEQEKFIDYVFSDARIRFGINLRSIRRKLGMSQEALAEATGKTREHIGYLERGERSPSFEMILVLSLVLRINPSDLINSIPIYTNDFYVLDSINY